MRERKGLLLILIFLISISIISAFPISPAKKEFEFIPNKEINSSYSVGNRDEKNDLHVIMYVEGDLNKSFELETKEAIIKPLERIRFFYTLKMPSDIKPGGHINKIIAEEVPPGGAAGLAAHAAVGTLVIIRKPYPGKYLEILSFEAPNTDLGKPIKFLIHVVNRGIEKIEKAKAVITILNPDGEEIKKLNTITSAIEGKGELKFNKEWEDYTIRAGLYTAKADVDYDGEKASQQKEFRIGELNIRIRDVSFENVKQGSIARFQIDAYSEWNSDINNVFAKLTVRNEDGNVVAEEISQTVNFKPWGEKVITAFWATEDNPQGIYKVDAVLNYADRESSTRTVEIEVLKKLNITLILLIAIIVLLAIILINFIIYKHKKEKNKKK